MVDIVDIVEVVDVVDVADVAYMLVSPYLSMLQRKTAIKWHVYIDIQVTSHKGLLSCDPHARHAFWLQL